MVGRGLARLAEQTWCCLAPEQGGFGKRLSGHDLVFVQHEKQRELKLARNVSRPGWIRMATEKMFAKGTVYVREKGGLAHIGIAQ
jgi:hypothetical protein